MATATLHPTSVHLVEPSARTYCGRFVARCSALVDYRDEGRRLAQKLVVTCPACLAGQAEDEATTAQLSEKRFTPGKPSVDDDLDDSDTDESEIEFGDDVGEEVIDDDVEDEHQSER
jgi:hypothetical protein